MSCDSCGTLLKIAEELTPCECAPTEYPFLCRRHGGCKKTKDYHRLCRTRPPYFASYEKGDRRLCIGAHGAAARVLLLGNVVEWLIEKATFGKVKPWPGCGCDSRKAFLNRVQLWPIRWPWRRDAR